jgi:ribosome-binding protein aMBF1 (putative translation factor)
LAAPDRALAVLRGWREAAGGSDDLPEEDPSNPEDCPEASGRADGEVEEGEALMELRRFIEKYVMTDPEWRRAYVEADATREAARALARARREAGLSQVALAKKVGTGQAVISRIESGAVSPTLDMVSRLGRGLGVRPVIAFESVGRVYAARKSRIEGRSATARRKVAARARGPRRKRK